MDFSAAQAANLATRLYFRFELEVLRQFEMTLQPRYDDAIYKESVKVAPPAHGDTTVVKEANVSPYTLSDSYIKSAASKIVDDKDAIPAPVRMTLIRAATGSCIKATLPMPADSAAVKVASRCIWSTRRGP